MCKLTIENELKKNGYHIATTVGNSMMPMLRNREDIVKIVPAEGLLRKYDLPLYKRSTGEYVLHRIVKVKKDHYVICGDNRFSREDVPFDWVVGVMESFYRDGVEILATDEKYIKYIKKTVRSFWWRRIIKKLKTVFHSKPEKVI